MCQGISETVSAGREASREAENDSTMFSLLTKQKLKRVFSKGEQEGAKDSINVLQASLCVCDCVSAEERFPGLRKIFDVAGITQNSIQT